MNHHFPTAKDIEKVHEKYPQLHFVAKNDSWAFVGSVDIVDKEGVYYDDYDIIIESTPFFPNSFPKLFETSGKFPKTGEWHTFTDGSCCTAVKQKEILTTRPFKKQKRENKKNLFSLFCFFKRVYFFNFVYEPLNRTVNPMCHNRLS